MATRIKKEEVDLCEILKDFFRETVGSMDGEVISAFLTKKRIDFEGEELVSALTRLLAEDFICLAYQLTSGIPKRYNIGFVRKKSL